MTSKTLIKKLMICLLTLCITFSLVPISSFEVEAAGNGVSKKLDSLREQYPSGKYWRYIRNSTGEIVPGVADTRCNGRAYDYHNEGDCAFFDRGWQCWAFASYIFQEVFGEYASSLSPRKDRENIQPGDYVRFTVKNEPKYGHSFVVLEKSGNNVKIVESNYPGGCQIKWDRWIDLTKPQKTYNSQNVLTDCYFDYYCHASNYDQVNNSAVFGSPISGGSRVIEDGDYHIVSAVGTGQQCLTIGGLPDAKDNDGANAELWSVLGIEDHVFTVTWLGDGFYKIKLKHSESKCLDVAGGSMEKGANVWQYQDNGSDAQKWRIDKAADGNGYTIQAKCSGYYLDVSEGKADDAINIQLWEGNNSNAQRWYFIPWNSDGDGDFQPWGEDGIPDSSTVNPYFEENNTNEDEVTGVIGEPM